MAVAGPGGQLEQLKAQHAAQAGKKDYGFKRKDTGRTKQTKGGEEKVFESFASMRKRAHEQEQKDLDAIHELEMGAIAGSQPFKGNAAGSRVAAERTVAARRAGRGRVAGIRSSKSRSSSLG